MYSTARSNPKASFLIQTAILVVVVSLVYSGTLSVGFFFDDYKQVLGNSLIRDVRYLPEILTTNAWSFMAANSNYYRPLMHATYMLCYFIFGLKPWGYHLVNLLINSAVSVLFLMTARKLFDAPQRTRPNHIISSSFIAALVFAVHPVHSDVVTWVASLPELLCAFFFLLSFYLYIRATEQAPRYYPYLYISAASFFFALLGKETALALPFVMLAYDYAFKAGESRIRDGIKRYAPYVLVLTVYLVMRFIALGREILPKKFAELSFAQYLINVPVMFASYILKLFLPLHLTLFHTFRNVGNFLDPQAVVSFLVVAIFIYIAYLARRRNKAVFIGLVLIAATLLPCLYIRAIGLNQPAGGSLYLPFADRYLYMPSAGFALLLASFAPSAALRDRKNAVVVILAFLFVLAAYSTATVNRVSLWRDELAFWTNEVKESPELDMPHLNLGMVYGSRGQFYLAKEQFDEALKISPSNEYAHADLGIVYAQEGLTDKAIKEFQEAVKLEPAYADAFFNLGLAYEDKGLLEDAIGCFDAAARLVPSDAEFQNALSEAYELKNKTK